jgi:peptidoglycan/xylan/chitin deacetylase (PgdA/CDA1 family)
MNVYYFTMASTPTVPILAWHSMNVSGAGYGDNDHAAFASDLEAIHRLGLRIVPVHRIVGELLSGRLDRLHGCVGLTFDDGPDFDWHDLPHPVWGAQRSMANLLADFRERHGHDAQPDLHATSFTIVSPQARAELDRTCMIGCRWWNDDWWEAAERSGLISIESHSWDHNHATLSNSVSGAPRGTFEITDPGDAEREIGQAAQWLRARRGRDDPVLFAYPYGHASDYLSKAWLPQVGEANGVFAAFTADNPLPVRPDSSRWRIPRIVCGYHWSSPGELEALLRKHSSRAKRPGFIARLVAKPESAPVTMPQALTWRECFRTWEVDDARAVAGDLFKHCFGHEIPDYPRHFVLVYSPPPQAEDLTPQVVAYVHQTPHEEFFLTGGMCVDATAYRRMPRWLFEQARDQGGLATIVTRDSMEMLGDSPAAFGHVGEPRARAADLRTGFVDTDHEHLMVLWRRELPEAERRRLIERAAAIGPF